MIVAVALYTGSEWINDYDCVDIVQNKDGEWVDHRGYVWIYDKEEDTFVSKRVTPTPDGLVWKLAKRLD